MSRTKRLSWLKLAFAFVLSVAAIVGISSIVVGGGGISGSGSVQRFRSIVLNDVEFFTEKAQIFVNGMSALEGDLMIGQVLEVDGHLNGETANADLVIYRSDIIGPIEQILIDRDREGFATMQILGQPVQTSVRTNLVGADLEDLKVGDVMELSGRLSANDVLMASFARRDSGDQYRLIGIIDWTGLDSFRINQLLVDTRYASIIGFDPQPSVGQRVEVIAEAIPVSSLGELVAISVEYLPVKPLPVGQNVKIEDLVNDVLDAQTFLLGERLVHTHDGTIFENGTPSERTVGTKVEVEGRVQANGSISADVVITKSFEAITVEGPVEAVDLWERTVTVTVTGLTFVLDSSTDFRESDKWLFNITSLEDISVGDRVEVKGFADGKYIVASRIKREKSRKRARFTAPVYAVDDAAPKLIIGDVTIKLDPNITEYSIDGKHKTQAEFLQSLRIGDFVEARWRQFTTVSEPPDDLELESR